MTNLVALWLPILVSAVIVFIASSVIWMATPLHKHDYKNPGDKEGVILEFLRGAGLGPGVYYVPWCQGASHKNPEAMAKMKAGPWAMITVLPGMPNMGKFLSLWFVHLLIVGVLVAYVAGIGMPAGTSYLKVFRVVGATALIAHAGYALPMSIWHGQPWSQLPVRLLDGVIYALLTAGVFGWLWPKVSGLSLPTP